MKLTLAIAALSIAAVTACTPAEAPLPPSSGNYTPEPERTGGPCGDGTLLKPGYHCP